MNKIILWLYGKITGHYPICDRCLDVEKYDNSISFIQYMRNRKGDNVYCRLCWNYIRLLKGECSKCHTKITQRDQWGVRIKVCPKCFNMIKLEVKS